MPRELTAILLALSVLAARSADVDTVRQAFADFEAACAEEGGALWGASLCGPLLVADFGAGLLLADRPDPGGRLKALDGLFGTELPPHHIRANTGLEWSGQRWSQVLAPLPDDPRERLRLLAHESFHRIQPEIGSPATEADVGHLDEEMGRYWQRLEWRALGEALRAETDGWVPAAADAVAFRERRLAAGNDLAEREFAGILNEGMAEYTGLVLAYGEGAAIQAARALAQADQWTSFARQHAYASGPAWGLLLDRRLENWRGELLEGRDLDGLLALAGIAADDLDLAARAARYRGPEIAEQERQLARERAAERSRLEAVLFAEGALVLPLREMQLSFDYRDLVKLPPHGTVYRTLTVSDRWGRVEVQGAALINTRFNELRLPPPDSEEVHRGSGWVLELSPGWTLEGGRLLAPDDVDR